MRKIKTFSWILSLVLLAACGTSRRSIAIEEGWELLGEQKVNFVRDVDAIEVNSLNKFTAIRFRIEDRDVRLNDLKIYFENGDKLEPSIDEVIPANQYSRDIQLTPDGRVIDKVTFRYRTTGNILKGRANLLVFGKKYDTRY